MNKREFVLGGCALVGAAGHVVAAGTAPQQCNAATAGFGARPPELGPDLAMAKWRRYLGDDFAVAGGRLRLTEVRAGSTAGAEAEQFSLLFIGAPADGLAAGTHQLIHGTGQRIALFMQPAGASAQGRALYRADFNLLT